MPIIDPILQYSLAKLSKLYCTQPPFIFYLRYLRIASRNINKNLSTIQASIMFKEDLKQGIDLINKRFGCQLSQLDLNDLSINNYYQFLYNKIIKSLNFDDKKASKLNGSYFMESKSSTKFFQPELFFTCHCWLFSNMPVAILCIDLNEYSEQKGDRYFENQINLEIDLMAAAGFTLVLCATFSKEYSKFLFKLICRNQFSEIHLNILNKDDTETFLFDKNYNFDSQFDLLDSYIYIYSPFIDDSFHNYAIFKKMKNLVRIQFLTFLLDIKSSLKENKIVKVHPFPYCKVGFKYDNLQIRLSNVPIYDFDNENDSDFIPTGTSGLSICYISPNDFLNWKNKRVKIIIDDVEQNHSYVKYVNFDDIHVIKKELYVKDTLYLEKITPEILNDINIIEEDIKTIIEQRKDKKFKKQNIFSFYEDKLIKNSIKYVTYAYACNGPLKSVNFEIHRPQLCAILEASKIILKQYNFFQKKLIKKKRYLEDFLSLNFEDFNLNKNLQNIMMQSSLYSEIQSILGKDFFKNNLKQCDIQIIRDTIKHMILEINKKLSSNADFDVSKGVVYQVETGEGKSCIITLIAAVLALNGKKVHITSSNIKLSNRDYTESFDFFKSLELKSAVLLHKNELPNAIKKQKIDIKNDSIENSGHGVSIFKDNASNYYNTYAKSDNNNQFLKYYKNKDFDYYEEKQFRNPSRMNFAVCGLDSDGIIPEKKNIPNIVYSTFTNFECLYLKMLELCPAYVDNYFENCALIIDEADSILIDEIANGTIVSKDMKSNSKEILTYVYHKKNKGIKAQKTFKKILKKWPNCVDLKLEDVKRMYSEIDLVSEEEFKSGLKYSIEEFDVKNKNRKKRLIKNTLNFVGKLALKVGQGLIQEFLKNDENNEEESENDDDDDDDDEEEEENNDDEDCSPITTFRHIVPFDYDHKGILEPNKQFGGFVQQFIAIKESEVNKVENMVINDISMSYLYVSHPIFVNLYSKVCGFSGTIGQEKEKNIYKDQYNLITKKIPRNRPNQRVEFPIILCQSKTERNQKIISEVLEFHQRGNPVLVIFQDLTDIAEFEYILHENGIHIYNIFDGRNDNISPKIIAGLESAVSLGTNVCGRGTDIIVSGKPLHVIISYYTSNTRIIEQAKGRTARQGRKGTSRIICMKDQYLYPIEFKETGVDAVIEEFNIKDQMQSEYIEIFKIVKPWIFSNDIGKQNLSIEDIKEMRAARINVNRIVAYNYQFPIKMKLETFLNIQAQKIFSILNCPNSKFTWILFQRYVREMILESWSLMINEVDEIFFEKEENKAYKKEFELLKEIRSSYGYLEEVQKLNEKFSDTFKRYQNELKKNRNRLLEKINEYLPFTIRHIVPSFMHIFKIVKDKYQPDILRSFSMKSNVFLQYNEIGFMSCQIGFKPYSLLTESGARINYRNYSKLNYIKDPELKYLKKMPNNKFSILSITEAIDDIFDSIFKKINKVIGEKTFLKLFLRRTLCGCEFGVCLNFSVENDLINDPNCIVDKDPLLLFTISVRSMAPVLAGALIIVLVYLGSLAKNITEWLVGFPSKFSKEIVKRGFLVVCDIVGSEFLNFTLDKIIKYLKNTLSDQLEKLKIKKSKKSEIAVDIIENLVAIFSSSTCENVKQKLSSYLGDKIKITSNFGKFLNNKIDKVRVINISLLVLFCIATFMLNFNSLNDSICNENEDAKEYDKTYQENIKKQAKKSNDEKIPNQEIENDLLNGKKDEIMKDKIKDLKHKNKSKVDELNGKLLKDNLSPRDKEMINKTMKSYDEISQSYLYKYKKFNPLKKIVNVFDFIDENEDVLNDAKDGILCIKDCIQKKGNIITECSKLQFSGTKKIFMEQVRIYATNKFPSILEFIGYSIYKKKQDLFVKKQGKETLETLIKNSKKIKIELTQKVIIAYGIAAALRHLHKNHVIHRNLNLVNIMLDSKLHPYLSGLYFSIQTDVNLNYILMETTPGFMAPEFIQDYKKNQCSFKLDVYSYGIILFMLITEKNPFIMCLPNDLKDKTLKGERPKIPSNMGDEWKNLIIRCWDKDPSKRPDFTEICNIIENKFISAKVNKKSFNEYKNYINRKSDENTSNEITSS